MLSALAVSILRHVLSPFGDFAPSLIPGPGCHGAVGRCKKTTYSNLATPILLARVLLQCREHLPRDEKRAGPQPETKRRPDLMNSTAAWNLDTLIVRPGVVRMPKLLTRKTVQLDAAAAIGLAAVESSGRFNWELIAVPDGSESALQGIHDRRVQFSPDTAGRYLIRLNASTARGNTQHVIRVCAAEDASIRLTTLEITASPAD